MNAQNRKILSGDLVNTLANIGVIVGLVFLVMEIRQANRIATATAEIETRNMFSEVNAAIYGVPEISQLLVKCRDKNAELSPLEEVQAWGFILRLTNAWLSIETAYKHDILPPDTYAVIEDDLRTALNRYPALARIFRDWVDSFPAQDQRQVVIIADRVLSEYGW